MTSLSPGDLGSILGGIAAAVTVLGTIIYKGIPYIKNKRDDKNLKRANEKAIRDVIIGRAGGAPNAITGEAGLPPLPSITDRMNHVDLTLNSLNEKQDKQTEELHHIKESIKNSTEVRVSKLEELTTELSGEIRRLITLYKIFERDRDKDHPNSDSNS